MNKTIIFDGAFGTYISSMGLNLSFPEEANILYPNKVTEIHKEYIAAGATAIKTNTFGANPNNIEQSDRLVQILKSGYRLAEKAAGENVLVFADMGPISGENALSDYIFIADTFISCNAKNFLIETLTDMDTVSEVIAYIKGKVKDAFIITSFAVGQDGYSRSGNYYLSLFDEAIKAGADYVGLNCVCGPAHILNLLKQTDTHKYNLCAMPNSGYPGMQNQRTVYIDNPEYFSNKLSEIYSLGVKAVGGCCGTTPRHIEMFTRLIKGAVPTAKTVSEQKAKTQPVFTACSFDKPFIAVELAAPVDTDCEYILSAAKEVKSAGADFVTIPDSPLGKTRANSFMISSLIRRTVQIEVIPHICCRDKNQIAIKGDLIGANIEGVKNILAITGDAIGEADRSTAKNVFGFNSLKLISFINQLNQTVFAHKPYGICAALNINAVNFDAELKRAHKKVENGAVCLFTQPIFTEQNVENYKKAKRELNCKIAVGIMPLAGYKNALFLNNEVAGIEIPQSIIDSLKDKDADEVKDICIDYAKTIIDKIKDGCDGYYIMTPLKKTQLSVELIKYIKENM
ncbi:MAG: bifunctional homocysteine S-methyltransferase/methylenetetrahydrofolate reductase [Clostridia bacterium]|nr:bifunctional homocysteine S-methyltransferase/methylenetetrahydrofolate reductase [Clostridia bacterium]